MVLDIAGNICKRDILAAIESDDNIVDIDENLDDPQLCATIACDIYKHLRASEVHIYIFCVLVTGLGYLSLTVFMPCSLINLFVSL